VSPAPPCPSPRIEVEVSETDAIPEFKRGGAVPGEVGISGGMSALAAGPGIRSLSEVLAIVVVARIPPSAAPRLPWWFWALMFGAGMFNIPVGASAVLRYVQVVVFGLLLLGASFLVAWTTTLGEIAPAVATLAAPLRRLRLPVDEWAVAIALSLRSLPLLLDEMRILRAGRRLRPSGSGTHGARDNTLTDLITAVMAVALRRAGELGEAITARGGTGRLTAYPARPGGLDVLAAVAVAAYVAAAIGADLLF